MLNYSTRILIIISFVIAIFLRLYQIDMQGFLDSDEFDSRLFIDGYWKYHNLEGIRGSFWGRPTFFLLDIFLYNLFGIDPLIFLIKSSICGILLVFVIYLIARNYFDSHTAIFASAIAAPLFTFVYYSRSMNSGSLSYLLVSLCLYFFFYYIKKKNKTNQKSHIYFGLFAALSISSHPNTIPIIFCIAIVYFLHVMVFEKINFFKILKKFLISFLTVIIAYELLFVLFRILPSFSTNNISSFIKFIFFLPPEIQGPTATFTYYLNLFYLQERWFFILSIFSALFAIYLIVVKKSFTAFSLLFISFFPIVLYVLLDVPAHLRNILSSLVPLVILNAWFLSNFLRLIKNKYFLNLFLIFITLSILYPAKDVYSKISIKKKGKKSKYMI